MSISATNPFLSASSLSYQVTVAGRVPVREFPVWCFRARKERVFGDSGKTALVESEELEFVALVFLDNTVGVFVSVEGVHEDQRDINVVSAIQVLHTPASIAFTCRITSLIVTYLDLADSKIKECHSFPDFNDTELYPSIFFDQFRLERAGMHIPLRPNATHGGT